MTAYSTCRGWKVINVNGVWVYADTKQKCWGANDRRPCKRCGKEPTPEGHDACIGHLEGVISACCGHGIKEDWITKE